jgi:hypothetical protein
MSTKLNIAQILNKNFALSQDDAIQLLPELTSALEQKSNLEISFDGIEGCSTLFLRALLGEFYLKYGVQVDEFIHFVGISEDDVVKNQLEVLRKRALNPDQYKPIFDNAIGNA